MNENQNEDKNVQISEEGKLPDNNADVESKEIQESSETDKTEVTQKKSKKTKSIVIFLVFFILTSLVMSEKRQNTQSFNYLLAPAKESTIKLHIYKPSQKSMAGLTKIDLNEKISYYTDLEPTHVEAIGHIIYSPTDNPSFIAVETLETGFKFYSLTQESLTNAFYNKQKKSENDPSFDSPLVYSNITLKNEPFRGISIKRGTYKVSSTSETGELRELEAETAYFPMGTDVVLVSWLKYEGSPDLAKTFEYICNTIY